MRNTSELDKISRQQDEMIRALGVAGESAGPQPFIRSLSANSPDKQHKRQSVIDEILSTGWVESQSQKYARETSSIDSPGHGKGDSDEAAYANAIKNNLQFQGYTSREEAIPEAYKATLEWIFTGPESSSQQRAVWSSFSDWLAGPSTNLYWITGKPGAGKSTLMKFLSHHQKTRRMLRTWSHANGLPLLTASFYFWSAGNQMQKSQVGLLRTLLLQCLDAMPHLAPRVCPRRWILFRIFGLEVYQFLPKWTWAELMESFSILQSLVGESFNLALFIDGLDEFDGAHETLIDFVKLFDMRKGVKICVSSRPENLFLDAFAASPSLRIETLTENDIQAFANGQLGQTQALKDLSQLHPEEAKLLVNSVTAKAQGVFLWVSVVVLALREGLTEGDKLSDLQAILEGLPSDLDGLYTSIWGRIKPKHIKQSSQFFQIHRCALDSLDVVTMWLADDEKALDRDMNTTTDREPMIEMMKRRLNSRTRGLLEVTSSGDVDYLHRSVREWADSTWDNIAGQDAGFDPHMSLLRALTIRVSENDTWRAARLSFPTDFWMRVCNCLYHAARVQDSPTSTAQLVTILDRLDLNAQRMSLVSFDGGGLPLYRNQYSAATGTLPTSKNTPQLPHWATTQCTQAPERPDTTFLGLVAQFGVAPYVRFKILQKTGRIAPSVPTLSVLSCATLGFEHFSSPFVADVASKYMAAPPDDFDNRLRLVRFLIERGALAKNPKERASKVLGRKEQETCNVILRNEAVLSASQNADQDELCYWREVATLFADGLESQLLEGKKRKPMWLARQTGRIKLLFVRSRCSLERVQGGGPSYRK